MAKVQINAGTGFDGEYEHNPAQQFTGHELHLIKVVSGVRLREIEEASHAGDYDLMVCIAVIAAWRAGAIRKENAREATDLLLAAEGGSITIDVTEDEAKGDAGPPAEQTRNADASAGSSNSSSSGSNGTSDNPQEKIPAPTGVPTSPTGSPEPAATQSGSAT